MVQYDPQTPPVDEYAKRHPVREMVHKATHIPRPIIDMLPGAGMLRKGQDAGPSVGQPDWVKKAAGPLADPNFGVKK